VRYAEPPEDLCDRVRFDEVFEEWGFYRPSWSESGRDWSAHRTYWYVRCDFMVLAEDGRFETVFGEFRPRGSVTLRVYREVAEAERRYETDVHTYFERPTGSDPVSVVGWWDAGVATTLNQHVVPYDAPLGAPGAASLNSRLLVRHGNLVMVAYAQAEAPLEEATNATDLLENFIAAMLDETAQHLSFAN
jgi:hypothetical protein